jgi:capsular exopolysaccharide synthesis family protein
MLQINPHSPDGWNREPEISPPPPAFASLGEVLGFLRRRARTIGRVLAVALLLGMAYSLLATWRYTAVSSLLIDARKATQQTILGDPISDSAIVESQVEVLRSQAIAQAVIDKLHLADDEEFNETPRNAVARALNAAALFFYEWLPGTKDGGASDPKLAAALRTFAKSLDVHRIGLSYVLQIQFTSESAAKAAKIANALVDSYLDEVLAAKFQAAEKVNAWLQQQMDAVRKKEVEATTAVSQFKTQTELVDSDRGAIENTAKLRDLETVARSYRAIYDNFVHQYAETLQTSSPTVEARVITHAIPPEFKSWPKLLLILPPMTFFGLVLGLLIALFKDRLDRSLRSPEQVEAELGVKCIGLFPISTAAARPIELCDAAGRELSLSVHGPMREVLDSPLSQFAETMRCAKVAMHLRDLACTTRVVGITSTLAGEGKTTAAFNLATLSARSGTRTMLIDADLQHPQLTRALGNHTPLELRDLLIDPAALERAVLNHRATGLDILPISPGRSFLHPEALLLCSAMQNLFTRARDMYGLVVVDLPPISRTVDVRAASHLLDAVVLVVEWGKTSRDVIREALSDCEISPDNFVGVLLNKVKLAEYRRSKWPPPWTGVPRIVQAGAEDPAHVTLTSLSSLAR